MKNNINIDIGRGHLISLDGYRGISAIFVAIIHISQENGLKNVFLNSELAVDFFFILSGFVISLSYERKLSDGMIRIPDFVCLRLIRLYPMIFAGAIIGILWGVVEGRFTLGSVVGVGGLALLLLPVPRLNQPSATSYPINGPGWSLTQEVLVNLVFAATARWLVGRTLLVVFLCAALAEIALGIHTGRTNFSVAWEDQPAAFLRTLAPFLLGVLLRRALGDKLGKMSDLWPIVGGITLAAVLMTNTTSTYYALACVFLVFPALIVAGSFQVTNLPIQRGFTWLGEISYPLYAINQPATRWLNFLFKKLGYTDSSASPFGIIVAQLIVLCAIAFGLSRLYDIPLRKRLRQWRTRARVGSGLVEHSQK